MFEDFTRQRDVDAQEERVGNAVLPPVPLALRQEAIAAVSGRSAVSAFLKAPPLDAANEGCLGST